VTLVELLVSLTILLVIIAAALSLYDASWDSFQQGETAATQQQGLRIAFDRIGFDLQMAGFNYNPDDDSSRPDEQIEAAYDTAIVLRADFDSAVEPSLAGGAFETVSTGNDEIVAYVLAKPEESNPDSLIFEADLAQVPRDGVVETLAIPGVALVHDDPPYTLYRITFSADEGLWGSPSFVVREILAENIGSMSFRYFDPAGAQLNPTFDLDSTSDDIGGGETASLDRSRIHRIEVELFGLARDPDPGWFDRSDPNPGTQPFHKFRIASNITPRNMRIVYPDPSGASGGSSGGTTTTGGSGGTGSVGGFGSP
jgi:hypothetical protein